MDQLRDTYIALGANLGDPVKSFIEALARISLQIGPIQQFSSIYRTRALTVSQSLMPDYLNMVVLCRSALDPEEILCSLLAIEHTLGRDRSSQIRWDARVIDLDLIAVGELIKATSTLQLPHPEMQNRPFVLAPLSEIDAGFRHPVLAKTVRELLALQMQDAHSQDSSGGEVIEKVGRISEERGIFAFQPLL